MNDNNLQRSRYSIDKQTSVLCFFSWLVCLLFWSGFHGNTNIFYLPWLDLGKDSGRSVRILLGKMKLSPLPVIQAFPCQHCIMYIQSYWHVNRFCCVAHMVQYLVKFMFIAINFICCKNLKTSLSGIYSLFL